jgi:hypothetical protein
MDYYVETNSVPNSGVQKYLMSHAVIIIHEYPLFGLSKIRYIDNDEVFIVDSQLLTETPIKEHTINLRLLGGISHDS